MPSEKLSQEKNANEVTAKQVLRKLLRCYIEPLRGTKTLVVGYNIKIDCVLFEKIKKLAE